MRDWNKPNPETNAEEMSSFADDEKDSSDSSDSMSQVKNEESEDQNRNDVLDDSDNISDEGELMSGSFSSEDSKRASTE
jgi:hypothetical protein